MIIVAGTFKFKADKLDEVKANLIKTQTISTSEEGCIIYRFSQSLEDDTVFHLYEEWENQATLDVHAANPELAMLRDERKPLADGDATVNFYTLPE